MSSHDMIKYQNWRQRLQTSRESSADYVPSWVSAMKIVNDWALITFAAVLVLVMLMIGWMAYGEKYFNPVLDFVGGNQFNMETNKAVYCCGDMVRARMNFQKTRPEVGTIKWLLRRTDDTSTVPYIIVYPARPIASPPGIYNGYVNVETLPGDCTPGQYHFEALVDYPLNLNHQTYHLRTTCFQIVERGKCGEKK
jgi:hypothetical protein